LLLSATDRVDDARADAVNARMLEPGASGAAQWSRSTDMSQTHEAKEHIQQRPIDSIHRPPDQARRVRDRTKDRSSDLKEVHISQMRLRAG
jgi:hypothetical protein